MPRAPRPRHSRCARARGRGSTCPTTSTAARLAGCSGGSSRGRAGAGAPLFAGWRSCPSRRRRRRCTLHRLNALRELRGALHGAAVLTVGLEPLEAISVRSPAMLPVFGLARALPRPAPLPSVGSSPKPAPTGCSAATSRCSTTPSATSSSRLLGSSVAVNRPDDLILVSVDDHICEPADMFDAHVPPRYETGRRASSTSPTDRSSGTTATSAAGTSG